MIGLVIGTGAERGRGTMTATVTVGTGTGMVTENDTTETVTTVVVGGMTTISSLSQWRRIVIVVRGMRRNLSRNQCDNMNDHHLRRGGGVRKMAAVIGGVRHVVMGGIMAETVGGAADNGVE